MWSCCFFPPQSLGTAPRWCPHLDALIEELEEEEAPSQYDDYKFVTEEELKRIGLENLIGRFFFLNLLPLFHHHLRLFLFTFTFTPIFLFFSSSSQSPRDLLSDIFSPSFCLFLLSFSFSFTFFVFFFVFSLTHTLCLFSLISSLIVIVSVCCLLLICALVKEVKLIFDM